MKQILIGATFVAGLTAASGCGSAATLSKYPDTIQLGSEQACHSESDASSTLCITPGDDELLVEATGLDPSGDFSFQGSKGDNTQGAVSADGTLVIGVAGQLVAGDFNIEGTWASGEPLELTVVRGN